ncbi:solute carrier organic anion transporter family member 2B1 isoform X1 [Xiphophorus hellerii]|uniref:solute carrier organic anion transporter family member 2B1 isoform X1 n=1 Tax=Xiphophorus hellerii TaxID=8084 RepID=UPI0013B3E3D3|nr:solute carrier organic anion transporter family member 2B1 isoform X1 [Xiphophorus hellerii]
MEALRGAQRSGLNATRTWRVESDFSFGSSAASTPVLLFSLRFGTPVRTGRREGMVADSMNAAGSAGRRWSPFRSIKVFVLCHSLLQLAQLLVSGYMKSSISTIERRYGLSSQKSGILAAFNEVGNTVLIVFVSFFGSRVHRPRYIGGGALLACLASLLMAVPHFLSGEYTYTDKITTSSGNKSGLCFSSLPSNQTCQKEDSDTQWAVYPLLLLGQLLLGIGAVPIQPFGISYIDDYASRRNSPLYLGILLAMTSIGPAIGFVTGSFLLRFYVDFDKLSRDEIKLDQKDLRWVGAWWLGFLVASSFLFLTALPYLFFPREMPKENGADDQESGTDIVPPPKTDPMRDLTLLQFLKSFPRIALRTLSGPIYLLVVLALVNMAALVSGLGTFMPKFIEKQFSQTIPFSNMMIGGIGMPLAVLGVVLGGALMRRFNMSVGGASKLCTVAILLCLISALPMLFIGCSTQKVAEVYPVRYSSPQCRADCGCRPDAFNPICGSNNEEYRSPCHAGCLAKDMDASNKPTNFTDCRCISNGSGSARPGTCGSGCSHLLLPFIVLMGITSFIISFTQTPSYVMVLRTVPPEDKSFAVGVQYMLFRVLAFLPGPVLYGSVIDTTCILWGEKCGQKTSCLYYNLDNFRQRFLGLMVVFVCGALLCFLLTMVVLRRRGGASQLPPGTKARYEMVGEQKTPEKEQASLKT